MKSKKQELRRAKLAAVAPAAPKNTRWPVYAAMGAALLAVWLAYSPALHGPFVFDDNTLPFALPGATANLAAWIRGVRPLTMISYWINAVISGRDPFSYHVLGILIHIV